jgi:hypothetical protein
MGTVVLKLASPARGDFRNTTTDTASRKQFNPRNCERCFFADEMIRQAHGNRAGFAEKWRGSASGIQKI